MKRLVLLLFIVSFATVSCGKAPKSSEMLGKWRCAELNRTLDFKSDGSVTMEDAMMTQNGRYELKGKGLELQWESLDYSTRWKVSLSGENLVIVMGEGRNTEAFTFTKVH